MQLVPDAETIKRWRTERGWSQDHLAELAGVSLRTVQRIENGEQASRDSLTALAAAFDVNVAAIMVDPATKARRADARFGGIPDGLLLSFAINAGSFLLGLVVFAGISMSDGPGGYSMVVPAFWWAVGVAAHGAVVALVWLVRRIERGATSRAP